MRYLLIFWAGPLSIFWAWYFLSLNDMNFGFIMLTRDVHDLAFRLYGHILGIDPAIIPGLVARACMFDTCVIASIIVFRKRKAIMAWWRNRSAGYGDEEAAMPTARSRSSAP